MLQMVFSPHYFCDYPCSQRSHVIVFLPDSFRYLSGGRHARAQSIPHEVRKHALVICAILIDYSTISVEVSVLELAFLDQRAVKYPPRYAVDPVGAPPELAHDDIVFEFHFLHFLQIIVDFHFVVALLDNVLDRERHHLLPYFQRLLVLGWVDDGRLLKYVIEHLCTWACVVVHLDEALLELPVPDLVLDLCLDVFADAAGQVRPVAAQKLDHMLENHRISIDEYCAVYQVAVRVLVLHHIAHQTALHAQEHVAANQHLLATDIQLQRIQPSGFLYLLIKLILALTNSDEVLIQFLHDIFELYYRIIQHSLHVVLACSRPSQYSLHEVILLGFLAVFGEPLLLGQPVFERECLHSDQ